ncbi:hypothetical protein MMC26_005366 [Xylographa opegraphella]|nr:hypothetical protein [Xylographa opegraphella]
MYHYLRNASNAGQESYPTAGPSTKPSQPALVVEPSPPEPVKGGETIPPEDGNSWKSGLQDIYTGLMLPFSHSLRYCGQTLSPGQPLKTLRMARILPKTFRFVLEYLYTHGIDYEQWDNEEGLANDLALLYIEASAFGLDSLKQQVISKLESLAILKDSPALVLKLGEEVYPQTPKSDRLFKDFFVKALDHCRGSASFPAELADRLIANGGDLAIDICKAERRRSSKLTAKEASMLVPGR